MRGKEIYDIAANLLGVKSVEGGDHADCTDYINRAPDLINALCAEVLYLDKRLRQRDEAAMYLSALEDEVVLDERLCYGVLPYGLAALLVAEEDAELYKMMREQYLLAIRRLEEAVNGRVHPIEDCYTYHG